MNLFHLRTINLLEYLNMNKIITVEEHSKFYKQLSQQISNQELYDIYTYLLNHDFKQYKERYKGYLKEYEREFKKFKK